MLAFEKLYMWGVIYYYLDCLKRFRIIIRPGVPYPGDWSDLTNFYWKTGNATGNATPSCRWR
ncbi:hypothetical protein [Methanobrevibacter sp.]|uniref:hypothetical protein n=1 Tax=Methanobrevibacter sp. TaxID=66852 RepID=UPI003890F480